MPEASVCRTLAPQELLSYSLKLNSNKGLVLSVGRCSNHASRALDDVGEIAVTIAATALKTSLTPYGRAVVLQQGDALPPPHHGIGGLFPMSRFGSTRSNLLTLHTKQSLLTEGTF